MQEKCFGILSQFSGRRYHTFEQLSNSSQEFCIYLQSRGIKAPAYIDYGGNAICLDM
jgi:hypothetical protein